MDFGFSEQNLISLGFLLEGAQSVPAMQQYQPEERHKDGAFPTQLGCASSQPEGQAFAGNLKIGMNETLGNELCLLPLLLLVLN